MVLQQHPRRIALGKLFPSVFIQPSVCKCGIDPSVGVCFKRIKCLRVNSLHTT